VIFSAIHSFIKQQRAQKGQGKTTFLKHFRVVNNDEKTTSFMMEEFNFIVETSLPSLEYDVCKELYQYKKVLQRKLGKDVAQNRPSSPSFFQKVGNYFSGNTSHNNQ